MKLTFAFLVFVLGIATAQALVISEIMSNPTGTDNGREWIELYNDAQDPVDLSGLTVSASESGTAISLTPLQGGTTLPPDGYAVIATIVSGQTKFLEDYPGYTGILFRVSSTFSLTNGSASLYIKRSGSIITSVPSYTAAAEGKTLSLVSGSYVASTPTPGTSNQGVASGEEQTPPSSNATTTQTDNQVTVPQATPPSPDIVIYMPPEKTVVAGADAEFTVSSATRTGKEISNVKYSWAFGDGGQSTGSSTKYRYGYAGRYVAIVEATSPTVAGSGRMVVRVVPPELSITTARQGKYGTYIDIANPNPYDLDLSQWILSINGAGYPFPKNTIIPGNSTVHFSGLAMGFASTTVNASTSIRILFPTLEEVTSYTPPVQLSPTPMVAGTSTVSTGSKKVVVKQSSAPKVVQQKATTTIITHQSKNQKDTRIISWFKLLLPK